MKNRIFALIATVAIVAVNPVFAMDGPPEEKIGGNVPKMYQKNTLVLEAKLSEDQRAAVVAKYIEPYAQGVKKMGGAVLFSDGTYVQQKPTVLSPNRYDTVPCLKLNTLEEMIFTTNFGTNIDEFDAKLIINFIKASGSTSVEGNPVPHTEYEIVGTESSPSPGAPRGQYNKVHFNLSLSPEEFVLWKEKIVSELDDFKNKIEIYGSIGVFETKIYENPSQPVPVEYDEDLWILSATPKIINEFKSEEPLNLSFNTFTLKYINDEGKIEFSESLDLSKTQFFDLRHPLGSNQQLLDAREQ